MASLFTAAASNPALMTEIVAAMRSAASGAGVTLADDPLQFVQAVSQNAAFRSGLQSQLSRLAATHGLRSSRKRPYRRRSRRLSSGRSRESQRTTRRGYRSTCPSPCCSSPPL
ncbi:MAG TPA: hypothetical protein VGC93_16010 [Thermoanaerobaculia bacterium]